MNFVPALLASLALLVPAAAQSPGRQAHEWQVAPENAAMSLAPVPAAPTVPILEETRDIPDQQQVRIEERVIIRIAPSTAAARQEMLAQLQRRAEQDTSYREERLRGCVPIDGIVRVMPTNENRLLLFMRDRRVLSAALERSCNSHDFYSGAYVERSRDGQLCSRREKLQSRTGASCQVSQLNRLVAEED